MDRKIVIAATVIACFVVACVTALSLMDKKTGDILTVVSLVVVPLLIGFGAIKINEAKQEAAAGRRETQAVHQVVNGNTNKLQTMLEATMAKADERAAKQDERFELLMTTFISHMSKGDG